MKKTLIVALALAGLAAPALAGGYKDGERDGGQRTVSSTGTVVVSCFRGPLSAVIWDHPNSKFIDTLVTAGYDFDTATAIAERICRDQSLVGHPERLRAEAVRVLQNAPEKPSNVYFK